MLKKYPRNKLYSYRNFDSSLFFSAKFWGKSQPRVSGRSKTKAAAAMLGTASTIMGSGDHQTDNFVTNEALMPKTLETMEQTPIA